jgi:hypothetical protein
MTCWRHDYTPWVDLTINQQRRCPRCGDTQRRVVPAKQPDTRSVRERVRDAAVWVVPLALFALGLCALAAMFPRPGG